MKKAMVFGGLFLLVLGASLAWAQSNYYTNTNHFACFSKENWEAAMRFAADQDKVAFSKMMTGGRCFVMKPGLQVHLEDSSLLGGWVRVRGQGMTSGVYCAREAISSR